MAEEAGDVAPQGTRGSVRRRHPRLGMDQARLSGRGWTRPLQSGQRSQGSQHRNLWVDRSSPGGGRRPASQDRRGRQRGRRGNSSSAPGMDMLHKIKYYITDDAAIKLYEAMILPYMDHGDIFFMHANSVLVKKLQTLQNRALRICNNARLNVPMDILHLSAQLPKLRARCTTHLLHFMYENKIKNSRLKTCTIATRLHDAPVFDTYKPSCEKSKTNVLYSGAIMWNNLPVFTCNIETFLLFKNNQKQWALSQT